MRRCLIPKWRVSSLSLAAYFQNEKSPPRLIISQWLQKTLCRHVWSVKKMPTLPHIRLKCFHSIDVFTYRMCRGGGLLLSLLAVFFAITNLWRFKHAAVKWCGKRHRRTTRWDSMNMNGNKLSELTNADVCLEFAALFIIGRPEFMIANIPVGSFCPRSASGSCSPQFENTKTRV